MTILKLRSGRPIEHRWCDFYGLLEDGHGNVAIHLHWLGYDDSEDCAFGLSAEDEESLLEALTRRKTDRESI